MHLVCAQCMRVNRVPEARLAEAPKCGSCHAPLLDDKPTVLTSQNFDNFVARNDLPVVVDFWATWCGPCKVFAPVYAQAANEYKLRLRLAKLDTDANADVAQRYAIRSIPTMVVFKQSVELQRISGALDPTRLRSWLQPYTA
jgi:thioredoxin 2